MMGLTIIVLGVVFVIQKHFVPMIYQQQIQEDMQAEINSLDMLLQGSEEENQASLFINFQLRQTYLIKVYDIYGNELFNDIPTNLRTSTVITLNNEPILDEYFDGLIPYVLRLEKKEDFIYRIATPTEGLYQTIEALDTLYLYIVIAGLFVATLASFIFSRNIVHPINTLKKMSETLGKKSLILQRNDEIGALSRALESLRTSLYETIDKLERELQREKRQDTVAKQFVSNVSHEYQTPLAVMLAAIETLADHQSMTDKDKATYFKMIENEARHLEKLSKDILLLSKFHIMTPGNDSIVVSKVLQQVMNELQLVHPTPTFKIKYDTSEIPIHMSEHHLKQVITNVVENAIFHHTNHDIMIEMTKHPMGMVLSVMNEASMDNDDLPHLTDPFYKKMSKGHGLGLAIVKGILDTYGFMLNYGYEKDKFTLKIYFFGENT
jgi:signal transduction histidine kinase